MAGQVLGWCLPTRQSNDVPVDLVQDALLWPCAPRNFELSGISATNTCKLFLE
jgi:hypothetical protein